MSRNFQKKNKDLVNLQVVSASQVWEKDKNGNYRYKKNLKIFGKVDKEKTTKKGCFFNKKVISIKFF